MRLWITLLIIGIPGVLTAQQFEATLNLGLNAAQIDGDLYSGYNKLGIHAGIGIGYPLNEKLGLLSGIYYDELGSQKELQIGSSNPEEQQKIQLTYISIPLLAHFKPIAQSGWLGDFALQLGLRNSLLINQKIQDRDDDILLDFFKKWNISGVVGLDYIVSDQLYLSIQFDESFNFLFNNNNEPSINSNSLRNRWLTFNIAKVL